MTLSKYDREALAEYETELVAMRSERERLSRLEDAVRHRIDELRLRDRPDIPSVGQLDALRRLAPIAAAGEYLGGHLGTAFNPYETAQANLPTLEAGWHDGHQRDVVRVVFHTNSPYSKVSGGAYLWSATDEEIDACVDAMVEALGASFDYLDSWRFGDGVSVLFRRKTPDGQPVAGPTPDAEAGTNEGSAS